MYISPHLTWPLTHTVQTHSHSQTHSTLHAPLTKQYIQIKLWSRPLHSYLPRLSLFRAGASVPLVRQRSLSFPAPGHVRGGGPLFILPVCKLCPVVTPSLSCVLSCVLSPSLLGQRALPVMGVRWSVSGGPGGNNKAETKTVAVSTFPGFQHLPFCPSYSNRHLPLLFMFKKIVPTEIKSNQWGCNNSKNSQTLCVTRNSHQV